MRDQSIRKQATPQIEYAAAVQGLRAAASRTLLAKAGPVRAIRLRDLQKDVERLAPVDPDAARLLRETLAGLTPLLVTDDDRWALAVELRKLRRSGWREHRLARTLLSLGIVRGDASNKLHVERARGWIRQQLHRHRCAVTAVVPASQDPAEPPQTSAGSGLTVGPARDPPGRESNMPRLIKRTTTEVFELDDDELDELPEAEEDEDEEDAEDDDE